MWWIWVIVSIAVMALILLLINKIGRELIRVIIYILSIPCLIGGMIYYNDIRTYILFGGILVFVIIYVYIYGKELGWWRRNSKK